MFTLRRSLSRRICVLLVVGLALTMAARSDSAFAAGSVKAEAQGLGINVSLVGGLITLPVSSSRAVWNGSGATVSNSTLAVNALPIAQVGAVSAEAGPGTGGSGGTARSRVAGINLLAGAIRTDAIETTCVMNADGISTTVNVANLRLGSDSIVNPQLNLNVNLPNVASVTIDKRTATWNPNGDGQYEYRVRALDVGLLQGVLGGVASGSIFVAESVCSGQIQLGTITTSTVNLAPGQSGTPKVTVTNAGDVAAANTAIRIPKPGADYVLDPPTVTGGGTCTTTDPDYILCTGVTVPGSGSVQVSLPVRVKASASGTNGWLPGATGIRATSTPVAEIPAQKQTLDGGGDLVTARPRISTGGTITVAPAALPAGKTATTGITVGNAGPSDASTTISIPIGNRPAGVTVGSASVGGTPCTVTASAITCANVTVPAGGQVTVNVTTSSDVDTPVGTTWDLANISAPMNGTAVTGQGRLLTVGNPEVGLAGGLTITPATVIPGGAPATARVKVTNNGTAASVPGTITLPAPPAGYVVSNPTVTGGGTCTSGAGGVSCTGVTIPAGGSVTVTMAVSATAGATADWAATTGSPVRATAGAVTGTATGPIAVLTPRFTLGVTATGPADGTVSPGQETSIAARIDNQGPSDARPATFTVVAPAGATFGPLTGLAGTICVASAGNTLLTCTSNLTAGGAGLNLTLPLAVSGSADPATPLTGGCVSLDGDAVCGGADDARLPGIALRAALADRLTGTFTPATVTPGATGTGKLTLRSSLAETGMTVTIPTGGLPTGFRILAASVPGGVCTGIATATITCTGVDLTANTGKDVSVQVAVDPGVTPPSSWVPTGVTITSGNETTTVSGALAGTGTVSYRLDATATPPANGSVEPGGTTSMTVEVTNPGPSNAPAAAFRVVAPGGTTFGTPLPAICQASTPALLLCTTTPLSAGAGTGQLTVPLLVAANADLDRPVSGGCVDVDGIPGCGATDPAIPDFTLRAPLTAQVRVTADRADVVPGDTATATLHVQAIRGNLTGVEVVVPGGPLPAGLTISGVTGPNGACAFTAGEWKCSGLSIADGDTEDIEITVAADPTTAAGASWNAGSLRVSQGGRSVVSGQELAVVAAADPGLTATATLSGMRPLPGEGGTLTVAVTNTGPSNAVNTPVAVLAPVGTVFDNLPAGCTAAAGGTRATCTVNLTVGGSPASLAFDLKISPSVLPGKAITGGCVDLDASGTCGPGDELIPVITVGVPLQQRLTVTTTPARIVPGEAADAVLTLRSGVLEPGLTVTIPVTSLPARARVTASPGFTCTTNTAPIVCTGVTVQPDTPLEIPLTVESDPDGDAGTWTAAGIRVVDADGQVALENGDLAVVGAPRSTLTSGVPAVPGPGTVLPGATADVTFTVTNAGPSDAPDAVFTVSAPAGTTFGTLPGGCVPNAARTMATCTMTLVDQADTGPLTFPVDVPAGADPFRPLTGGCVELDGVPGCGPSDEAIPAITLKVPFDRTVTAAVTPATVSPGRTGTVTLRLTAEVDPLTGIDVTIPDTGLAGTGLTVTGVESGGVPCPGTPFVCTGLSVGTNTPTVITLTVDAAPAAVPGATWNATGIEIGDGADSITVDRRLATVGAADVVIGATVAGPGPLEPGESGNVSVTVANTGYTDATGVEYTVIPPAGARFDPLPAGCVLVAGSGGQISCTTSVPGRSPGVPVQFPLVVDAGASPGTTLTGGCVDLGNDGVCQVPPDEPIGSITVQRPFAAQVEVRTNPVTIAPGGNDVATIEIVVDEDQGQNLDVTIPLGVVPGTITIGSPTATRGGACAVNGAVIECTGLDFTVAGTATVSIPVAVASPADEVWGVTGVEVVKSPTEKAYGGGILLRTSTPAYALTATFEGPVDDTAFPGGVVTLTATVSNTTATPATGVPIIVRAPAGTTFPGTGQPAGCTVVSPTVLSCVITVAPNDSTALAVKVLIPNPPLSGTVGGGCVDLGADGRCDTLTDDEELTAFTLRTPLTGVITVTPGPAPAVTPGRTATTTLQLTSALARDDLTLTVSPPVSPADLAITGATLSGGVTCDLTGGVVTCEDVRFAANGSRTLTLTVAADPAAAPAGTAWWPRLALTAGPDDTVVLSEKAATIGAPSHGTGLSATVSTPATGTVLPGGSSALRLVMTNPGPSTMPGARVTVEAPSGVTFGALDPPASTYCLKSSSTVLVCTVDLGVEARLLQLPIDVPPTATPGATISGGCVDMDNDGVCGAGDRSIPAFVLGKPFRAQAPMSLVPGTVVPGDTATAVVRVTADRPLSGLTATIPIALPAGMTVTGATGPAGSSCTVIGEVTCTGITVPAGAGDLIRVTVRAAATMPAGQTWAPTVTLADTNGATSVISGALMTTGEPEAGLSFTVSTLDATVSAGDQPEMVVLVTRGGPSAAAGNRVRLRAPTGTTFVVAQASDLPSACSTITTDRLECQVTMDHGDPPQTWRLKVQVPVNADPDTVLTGGCVDVDANSDCGDMRDAALPSLRITPVLNGSVTITATDAPVIQPGRTGTITISLGATWARTGLGLTIPLTGLPAGLSVARAQGPGNTDCQVTADAVTCTDIDISDGGSVAITVNAEARGTAVPATAWNAAVTVTLGADAVTRTLNLATVGTADTAVSVSVAPPAAYTLRPGGTGEMTVTLTNAGSSVARAMEYRFLAPSGTTFLPPAGTTASLCSAVAGGTRMDCVLDVAGNARVQLALPFQVSANADVRTPLRNGCVDIDRDGVCDTGDREIPDIQLALPFPDMVQVTGVAGTVTPGLSGTGAVRVTALAAFTGVTVVVPLAGLPSGLTVVGATGPAGSTCTRTDAAITCTGVDLVAGDTTAVTISVRADAAAGPGVTWSAGGITVTSGTETATGAAPLIVTGPPSAAVTWSVSGLPGTVTPGATQTITVTANNPGPSSARGGTATVVAPANTSFGTLTGAAATACRTVSKTVLTCTYDLAAGAGVSWQVPLVVDRDARAGDKLGGGCVSVDGDATCGAGDVRMPEPTITPTLRDSGTIAITGAVIDRGTSGTATITITATSAFRDLTLTVPLGGLPAGFTVASARLGGTDCQVTAGSITCTGVSLAADTPQTLSVRIDVAPTAAADAVWRATGITLADPRDASGGLTGAGVLAGTSAAPAYQVSVSLGAPSLSTPARTQTTVLPITLYNAGPAAADPYPLTVLLPAGTTHGALPPGCVTGPSTRTVVCRVPLAAGASQRISLPLVVDETAAPDSVLTGGCLDGALAAGPPVADAACAGGTDIAIPDLTVGRFGVDLDLKYPGGTVPAPPGASLVVKLNYDNHGTETATNVRFTIAPPAGVTVRTVEVMLSDEDVSATVVEESIVVADCTPAPGVAPNAVVCQAPDEASEVDRQAWITLAVGTTAATGLQPMRVTITTTDAEGNMNDNWVDVPLQIAAADDPDDGDGGGGGDDGGDGGDDGGDEDGGGGGGGGDGGGDGGGEDGDDLPKTGPRIVATVALSTLMLALGAGLLIAGGVSRPYRGRHSHRP